MRLLPLSTPGSPSPQSRWTAHFHQSQGGVSAEWTSRHWAQNERPRSRNEQPAASCVTLGKLLRLSGPWAEKEMK